MSTPSTTRLLLAGLLVALLAGRHAGAASLPRAPPRAVDADLAPLLQGHGQAGHGDELDASALQALNALSALSSLQDEGGTVDILVPMGVWGLQDGALLDGGKIPLSPSERISLPFIPSILPHVNTSCSCKNWECGCCATVEIAPLRKNKTGCASLMYVKDQLAVVLRVTLNNRTLAERELISGMHPPPFCFPVPQLPFITVCLRFSNISLTSDAKIQACASVELGLVFTSPLVRLRFGCLRVGPSGAGWSSKPVSHSLNSGSDIEADALQQFAAAFNATDKEQFLLLQSILRQESSVFDQSPPVKLTKSPKMIWPDYQQGSRYN